MKANKKILSEEMPENPADFQERMLEQLPKPQLPEQTNNGLKILTEDLPQED